jgi:hypothetical protein
VTASIVRDHAITLHAGEHHLRVPGSGVERPAMRENDGLSRAPVLAEDIGAVFGGDRRHGEVSFARGPVIILRSRTYKSAVVSEAGRGRSA